MKQVKSQEVQPSKPMTVLSEKEEELQRPPKPDPRLVSRPRMGKYSNVAKGGEDILIRILDWLAGERASTNNDAK